MWNGLWLVANNDSIQVLRPKWKELYAARRRQRCAASGLPELPDSFFGWIPVLYRITEEEVLHSAGLDAYVVSRRYPILPFATLKSPTNWTLWPYSFSRSSNLRSDYYYPSLPSLLP
jgi:hypothetical protein